MSRTAADTAEPSADYGIAEVERETGLGKDTLRVWERRYGFPQPGRDAQGERRYDEPQLQRLRLLRQLLDRGLRPGQVVAQPLEALRDLLAQTPPPAPPRPRGRPPRRSPAPAAGGEAGAADEAGWLSCLLDQRPELLRTRLREALRTQGLVPALEGVVSPLAGAVGQAWAEGRLTVFQEHLFTEAVEAVLREAIAQFDPPAQPPAVRPRVLLTTLPQELHRLGLLMAEAALAQQACQRLALGPNTPVAEIAEAARRLEADVVAIGTSAWVPARAWRADLARLRERLPPEVALWVGGPAQQVLQRQPLPGVTPLGSLQALQAQVARWRNG